METNPGKGDGGDSTGVGGGDSTSKQQSSSNLRKTLGDSSKTSEQSGAGKTNDGDPSTEGQQSSTPAAAAAVPAPTTATAAPVNGGTKPSQQTTQQTTARPQSDSDDEDDQDEVLEESPCGRWQKRREQVKQRDVPGIDIAYLAMDTETGNEVVWNEVQFSERKNFRASEANIRAIFDNLMELDHCNLVKFYKWWTDEKKENKPRIIFITEYMSSGNMSQFLKRTRKGNKVMNEKSWKKWSTQILSALSYLHSSDPAIIHGNLSCNTIFIQQNGLIKIGCVAPNAIHHHVKTFRDNMKGMHYIAPEYESSSKVTEAADIYSFGICLLEMAVLGFSNGDASTGGTGEPSKSAPQLVTHDLIQKKLGLLEEAPMQKDFIESCLRSNPVERPTARELLFHGVLFEVHSLKLLAAHVIVNGKKRTYESRSDPGEGSAEEKTRDYLQISEVNDSLIEDHIRQTANYSEDKDRVVAEIRRPASNDRQLVQIKYSQIPTLELDKFLEDVKNGIYPLTAFASSVRQPGPMMSARSQSHPGGSGGSDSEGTMGATGSISARSNSSLSGSSSLKNHTMTAGGAGGSRGDSSALGGSGASGEEKKKGKDTGTPEPSANIEDRRITNALAEIIHPDPTAASAAGGKDSDPPKKTHIRILLKLDDNMNRELTAELGVNESPNIMVQELVSWGLINEADVTMLVNLLTEALASNAAKSHQGE